MIPARPDPRREWIRLLWTAPFGSVLFTVITALMDDARVETAVIASCFTVWLFVAAARTLSWRRREKGLGSTAAATMSPTERLLLAWHEFIVFATSGFAIIVWASVRAHRFRFSEARPATERLGDGIQWPAGSVGE